MSRPAAILGSAFFLAVAPGTLGVYLPWTFSRWHFAPPLLGWEWLRVAGAVLIIAGVPVLLECFARFVIKGLGTPAPVAPPARLVVSGLYRYVRNPMYVAVVSIVLGQALLFGSASVLEYAAVLWVGFFAFVVLYEEPTLRRKFGPEFEAYCAHVRRWIPRLRRYFPETNI
jgi:protein-S-isoprenylcysteine O-methyltransferase Ste14